MLSGACLRLDRTEAGARLPVQDTEPVFAFRMTVRGGMALGRPGERSVLWWAIGLPRFVYSPYPNIEFG